ncbi:efflux RND transporter periplasmic adaptor subunit [Alcaligenaceae bacterium]|nr:efflux RND transporter periplasmic adaptor subunit [Alcaligenaceae bacterium]
MFPIRQRYLVPLGLLAAALFAITIYRANAGVTQNTPADQPLAAVVDVAVVHSKAIVDWHAYSGRLEAVEHVQIRPQVSGAITALHFADGGLVHKGDELFTIDPRPYEASVNQATARFAAAQARAAFTASELQRGKRLLAANAIASRDVDEKRNAARVAKAEEASAAAALQAAQLDLEHTRVVAPISGRASRAEVTLGNVVQAGPGAPVLTSLVSVDKVYASFDMDEQSFLRFLNKARLDPQAIMPVELGLGDDQAYPRQGHVVSIDNHLDTASGTIRVRAVFDNADGALLPGLYARVRLSTRTARQAVLVDEKAIGTDQSKRYVLVVDAKSHVNYREVTLGPVRDGSRIVESGLAEGERIVVGGLQRVRPGDSVQARVAVGDAKPDVAMRSPASSKVGQAQSPATESASPASSSRS